MESSTSKLTVGRFFHNIADSFANTRLRIPPDPETAYRKFCGDTPPPTFGLPHAGPTPASLAAVSTSQSGTATNRSALGREIARPDRTNAPIPRHIVALAGFV